MNTYAFITGRKADLSLAEIRATLTNPDKSIQEVTPAFVIANIARPLAEPQRVLNRLGGTIKIVDIFEEISTNLPKKERLQSAIQVVLSYLRDKAQQGEKLKYSVSLYNIPQQHKQIIKKILTDAKKQLRSNGINSRYINKTFDNPPTAAIVKENLIERGTNLVLLFGEKAIYIGRGVAIQDIDAYSQRDYERPARDARLGMLPPKLAQIMINLTGIWEMDQPETSHNAEAPPTLYDPFVGLGTVLMEGILMGYNGIGSDIQEHVIEGAHKNLAWLEQQVTIQGEWELFAADATKLSIKNFPTGTLPTAIVTESYLGPPLSKPPSPQMREQNFQNISMLLTKFFEALHPIISKKTPLVICFAAYREGNKVHTIPHLAKKIEALGYRIIPLLPTSPSLLYDRPDQVVARQIWQFKKV